LLLRGAQRTFVVRCGAVGLGRPGVGLFGGLGQRLGDVAESVDLAIVGLQLGGCLVGFGQRVVGMVGALLRDRLLADRMPELEAVLDSNAAVAEAATAVDTAQQHLKLPAQLTPPPTVRHCPLVGRLPTLKVPGYQSSARCVPAAFPQTTPSTRSPSKRHTPAPLRPWQGEDGERVEMMPSRPEVGATNDCPTHRPRNGAGLLSSLDDPQRATPALDRCRYGELLDVGRLVAVVGQEGEVAAHVRIVGPPRVLAGRGLVGG